MLRWRAIAIALGLLATCGPARADDPAAEFPDPTECFAPLDDSGLAPLERATWTACEKWVWSCIRKGEEANLYAKNSCMTPRAKENVALRKRLRLAAFKDPQRFETANAISDKFLLTILTDPAYSSKIPPVGIRIFGAYFKDPVNLENLSTTINLVLDGSIMLRGLRLTNFKTDKNLSLDMSNIHGSLHLMRARIDGSVFVEKGVFDTVDLNDARIGSSFEATGSVFTDILRMHRAHIDGKVILTKARLTSLSTWNSFIGSALEMRLADIRHAVDLTGSVVDGDVHMQDVSFGRQTIEGPVRCDWDPGFEVNHVLNDLKGALTPEDFAKAWKETVEDRPSYAGVVEPNVCEKRDQQDAGPNTALLRGMKIRGSLCLVDVTGEITTPNSVNYTRSIETISLDSTTAGSTILSWKTSPSLTRWQAVNFKTSHMLINLNSQPLVHYTDNLDVGVITFLRPDATTAAKRGRANAPNDEYLVRLGCDVIPGADNTEVASDLGTQDRIIRYFASDKSGSAQPFADVVSRLDASSINTVHLKKALSKLKYKNACTTSQLMKSWNELPWLSVWDRAKTLNLEETRKFALDGLCTVGFTGYKYAVSYGHEPHNLFFWALGFVLVFWALLKFDSHEPHTDVPGKKLGFVYALDKFIPLQQFRLERRNANVLPNSRWLRAYLSFHRLAGAIIAVMIFLFVINASK